MFLLIIVNGFVCEQVSIHIAALTITNPEASKAVKHFQYEVGFDVTSTGVNTQSVILESGQYCLNHPVEIYRFLAPNPGVALSDDFYVSVDSKAHEKNSKIFNRKIEVKTNKEFCVLWGSWIPKTNNDGFVAQFFFNIITGATIRKLRFLYFFETTVEYENTFTNLKLNILGSNEKDNENLPFNADFLIAHQNCKNSNTNLKEVTLQQSTFTLKGVEGDFKMYMLVDQKEDNKIKAAIEKFKNDSTEEIAKSSSWGDLTCNSDGFVAHRILI